jgi:hypothetical protein
MWTPPIAQFWCGLTAGGNLGSNTVVIVSSALNVRSSRVALVDHRHQPHYGRRTLSSKVIAKKLGITLYQVKHNLWTDYLRNELRNPRVPTVTSH